MGDRDSYAKPLELREQPRHGLYGSPKTIAKLKSAFARQDMAEVEAMLNPFINKHLKEMHVVNGSGLHTDDYRPDRSPLLLLMGCPVYEDNHA